MKKSTKFLIWCLCFICGVALGEEFQLSLEIFVCVSVLMLLLMLNKKLRFLGLSILLLIFGCFWNNYFIPGQARIKDLPETNMTFVGIVSEEPQLDLKGQKLTMNPEYYSGKILISKERFPEYKYGDKLKIICDLVKPKPIEDFRYDKYLEKEGIEGICYRASIILLAENQGNFLFEKIFQVKNFVLSKLNKTIVEPHASLLAGILIGAREGIPLYLSDQMKTAGVSHIVAISGYNITVLVVIILSFLNSLYINRKKAVWIVLIFLVLFVIFTGASASVVRAAVMGGLVLVGKYLGRRVSITNVFFFGSGLMVLFNPKILFWDGGFQLSFLATAGLIYLSPIFKKYFEWLPDIFSLKENFISTMAAIIFTLPLLLYNYGQLSTIAPLVNLLILPVLPLIMGIGFLQLFVALFFIDFGQVVGWGTWLLLSYIIEIVEFFSERFPSVELSFPWYFMVIFYCLIIFFIFLKKERKLYTVAATKK